MVLHLVRPVRVLLTCLVVLLSGCLVTVDDGSHGDPDDSTDSCGPVDRTFWFDQDFLLREGDTPAAGMVFSNGFDEAFLTDEMDVWLSEPATEGMIIEGNMTLEYWVRNDGTPAPVVLGGAPEEGYHWFNQVGTDQTFVTDYAREYSDAVPEPGSIDHYVQTIAMPEGGLVVEPGDRLRVLLTSLVVDDEQGRGQQVLFGGQWPSSLSLTSTCYVPPAWKTFGHQNTTVEIAGNQGLITGQVPATQGVNFAEQSFTLDTKTERLTIRLTQKDDQNPNKDDMDITIHDASGKEIWSIGSPYSNEAGRLWQANLEAMMPPGDYTVRINSYSGFDYTGKLEIIQDRAV